MGQIFFGTKSARTKYEFDQICLGPTNYLRNWRWPIFLDQLLLGPNADNLWAHIGMRNESHYLHFLQVHQAIAICVSELGELLSFTCHPVRLWQRRWDNNIRSEKYHVRHQPRPRPCTCPQCIRQCWPAQINFSKILKLRNQESIQSIRPVLTCPSPSLSMSSRVSWTTMSLMCSASSGWRKAENS